jgi:glycosyltransferase involved in cell wall biosynthesis
MKIALDVTPIESGHSVRGIGSYTKNLKNELENLKSDKLDFVFFGASGSLPDADVIHHPYFDLFFRTLKLKKGVKTVVTIHDVIPLVFPNYFPAGLKAYINLFFQKRALKKIDAIICDSQTSKKDIIEKLSIAPSKVHVVYLSPSRVFGKIKPNPATSRKFKLPEEFVLYVGDVNWNKNIPNLLEAIKISKKNLVLVGKALADNSISETQRISRKILSLGIQKNIIKTGFIEETELNEIYNLAKLTILPSYYEGFGLPVLESMACGTPVVCSNVASLSEIAGKSAFFCEPSNPRDMAQKINQVFEMSETRRNELSRKLITHASKYNWEKTAADTIKVYKSLL